MEQIGEKLEEGETEGWKLCKNNTSLLNTQKTLEFFLKKKTNFFSSSDKKNCQT